MEKQDAAIATLEPERKVTSISSLSVLFTLLIISIYKKEDTQVASEGRPKPVTTTRVFSKYSALAVSLCDYDLVIYRLALRSFKFEHLLSYKYR